MSGERPAERRRNPKKLDPPERGRFGRVGEIGAGGGRGADAPITSQRHAKRRGINASHANLNLVGGYFLFFFALPY
jgi:hypothetical protein